MEEEDSEELGEAMRKLFETQEEEIKKEESEHHTEQESEEESDMGEALRNLFDESKHQPVADELSKPPQLKRQNAVILKKEGEELETKFVISKFFHLHLQKIKD